MYYTYDTYLLYNYRLWTTKSQVHSHYDRAIVDLMDSLLNMAYTRRFQ